MSPNWIKGIDIVMNFLGPAFGVLGVILLFRQANHQTMRTLDVLTLFAAYAFMALFLQFADQRMTDQGLHWVQIRDLSNDAAEKVFGDSFFMAAFWMGALSMIAAWILPDVLRFFESMDEDAQAVKFDGKRNPNRRNNWPWV